MNKSSNSFLEPKTLLAIFIVFTLWILWQKHLENKYPTANSQLIENQNKPISQDIKVNKNEAVKLDENKINEEIKTNEEKTYIYEDDTWKLEISSRGMGLKTILLKTYKDREKNFIILGEAEEYYAFETTLNDNKHIPFNIVKINEKEFVGKAEFLNGAKLEKRIKILSATNSIETHIYGENLEPKERINIFLSEKIKKFESGSFFAPSMEHQEFFITHSNTSTREIINKEKGFEKELNQSNILSIGSQYFSTAIVNKSEILPDSKIAVSEQKEVAQSVFSYPLINNANQINLSFIGYAGPKSLSHLKKVDDSLTGLIDYGWFGFIAIPMLKILIWFFSIFGNYGVAIIFLTLLVRVLVLPFAIMSFKSMKAMQVIQPQMKVLREKYKNDPQTLNKEVMALMKENKANPMSSCLPMLLQFPVFIALYRVLGASIELYQTPFIFWVNDLSLKDPFYVLPILMGITMFIQQKITPTNMDPTQQKIFLILPIFMTVIMASLPSGLTLYIFISTLFGIFQQLFFLKERVAQTESVQLKA